jgi:protease-4
MGSPVREMAPKEKEILESLTRKIHRQFIRDIVSGRGMDLKQVESVADGRIFTGEESLSMGLVDRLGNIEDAIEWAGRLGGIKGEITAVYAKEKKLSFVEYLLMHSRLKIMLERLLYPGLRADYIYEPSVH